MKTVVINPGCHTTAKVKKRPTAQASNMQSKVLRALRDNIAAKPEEVVSRLFPDISSDSKEFHAKTRLVKKALPNYLRNIRWRKRITWTGASPELFMRLSLPEKQGRKVIGSRRDPCECLVSSDGSVEVRAYQRHWKGWLIQRLINLGCPKELAEKQVMSLECRSATSELSLKLNPVMKKLGQFTAQDSDTNSKLKVGGKGIVLELSPEVAAILQKSWDKNDETLSKLRSPVSLPVVLASVGTLRIDRLFQGLGLNPQQARQASDTLVSLGVEDQPPDFVYLVYGPKPTRSRQIGLRALITPHPSYEIRVLQR